MCKITSAKRFLFISHHVMNVYDTCIEPLLSSYRTRQYQLYLFFQVQYLSRVLWKAGKPFYFSWPCVTPVWDPCHIRTLVSTFLDCDIFICGWIYFLSPLRVPTIVKLWLFITSLTKGTKVNQLSMVTFLPEPWMVLVRSSVRRVLKGKPDLFVSP